MARDVVHLEFLINVEQVGNMKNKVTKILIAGAVVVIAISAVVIVKNRVSVNRDGTAV